MMQALQSWNRRDALAVLFLVAWHCIYFFPVTLAQTVWFGGDFVRQYYPWGVELSRALRAGRLHLWTTGIDGGVPLLADGQLGALYPVNLILFVILPPHFALSYSILFHLVWAAIGTFLWVRFSGFRASSAVFASIVFSFSGFMLSRLAHMPILLTISWLPWLVFFQGQFQRAWGQRKARAAFWFGLTALALGIQLLCGSPQVALMNILAFALVGFCAPLFWDEFDKDPQARKILRAILGSALPIILGIGIAAIQIVPTAELVGYSMRGGASSFGFVTSYSLPPEMLQQFIAPFIHGEPAEGANNEYWAYLGLVPFFLVLLAPIVRRDARTTFFTLFALGALSLALGERNPVYRLLYQLPGFGFFRVPARYLMLFVFAGTFLSATGLEELSSRLVSTNIQMKRTIAWGVVFGCAIAFLIWLAQSQGLEFWLQVWQWLPMAFLAASLGILALAWTKRLNRTTFQTLVLGLTLFDLTCAAPLFVITLGRLNTPSYVLTVPRSLAVFDTQPGHGRVFTDLYGPATIPAIRTSLYPNTALSYGKESAQAYSSLAFAKHAAYLADLSPAMLNLLNVKYFTVPLEPRPETKMLMPFDTVAVDVLDNEEIFAPITATAIGIVSFTERAENLVDGTPVGQVLLRRRDGRIETFPLRVGVETADWDYARKQPQHQRAPIAHAFPAFWRAFGRAFEGNTYAARFAFDPGEIIGVNVRVLQPEVRLTVERVTLYNADNQPLSLAKLVGKNDFTLVYLSDTAAIWENRDVLPRAFVVHAATVADDGGAFAQMRAPGFQPTHQVLLADGQSANFGLRTEAERRTDLAQLLSRLESPDMVEITDYQSERVSVKATTDRPGYLVLTDSWYPGWNASVDGQPAPIYRANVLFRAVPIEPGTHMVKFEYRPDSFFWGALVSLSSLISLGGIVFVMNKPRW